MAAGFTSFDAAHHFAVERAREIMRESLRTGVLPLGYALEVADRSGRPLATVPFCTPERPG